MASVDIKTFVMKPINQAGAVVDKSTATQEAMLKTTSETRVNTDGFPTLASYLTTMYADSWTLIHLDQTYIIMEKA
jgi:hypothetical protein